MTRLRLLAVLLAAALAGVLAEPGAAQTIVPGGPPTTVSTTSPGENASVFFDAVAGQRVSLEITDVTIGTSTCCSARVSLLRPDGRSLTTVTVGTNGGFLDATALPSTGTYTVLVDPQSTNVGDATLTLHGVPPDVTDTVAAGGAPVTATTTVPGQNALVTFAGTAGQRVSVAIADVTVGNSTCCSVRVSVLRPDGKTLVAPLFPPPARTRSSSTRRARVRAGSRSHSATSRPTRPPRWRSESPRPSPRPSRARTPP